ncbi:hypothetical protein CPB85DRAFT_1343508 [Mucidula mucida]|nr:hypothetical protein CPB85DRAFT_1343508 [Mucidula mucida]
MAESFQDTFGCMFIALVIDLICYGAGFLAIMQYFRSGFWTTDTFTVRFVVISLALLSSVHVTTFIAWAYDDLILRFGAFMRLDDMPRTAISQLLAIYLVSFISQSFFVSRIWFLTKNVWVSLPIALLALLNISAGLAQTILSAEGGTFSNLVNTKVVTSIQVGATAGCDLSITIALCIIFNKKRTGMRLTDTLLDKLILYAINRGAVTTLAAIFNLVLFVLRPEAMIFMIALLPSCQFYVLSVIASLNSRTSMREGTSTGNIVSVPLEPMHPQGQTPSGIHVSTNVVTWGQNSDDRDSKLHNHALDQHKYDV